jgi:hypothetical protein
MYKLFKSPTGAEFVIDTSKNAYIPFASDNTDYQAYLKWLEEGNTPEPADEQGA